MSNTAPVLNVLALEQSHNTSPATSSTFPRRFRGLASTISCTTLSPNLLNSVSTGPGATQFTRMLVSQTLRERAFVNAITPALAAEYAARFGRPEKSQGIMAETTIRQPQGWRPDQNIDPRIMVSPNWISLFKPFPDDIRRTLAQSLLAAWMDKTQQYPITKYLPILSVRYDYNPRYKYRDISGGRVWEAAGQFRATGVSKDLVERLQNWGLAYTDRAARLQYH